MRVLAAVFADAGNVAFDVAGVEGGLVEGRVQQLDQRVLAADQELIDGVHGEARCDRGRRRRTARTSFAGSNRCGIRGCWRSRAGSRRRSRRGGTIRHPSHVAFDAVAQAGDFAVAAVAEGAVGARVGQRGELREDVAQEERQPDAFAFAVFAH